MLRIEVQFLPFGAPPVRVLGYLEIVNTGTGTPDSGDYEVTATVRDGTTGELAEYSGTVTEWPRQERNALELLRAALNAMIGDTDETA